MASSGVATRGAFKRTTTTESAISSPTSKNVSPFDSPKASPSSTSLSSMGSDALDGGEVKSKAPMLDTYGNEFELPNFTMKEIHDAIPKHCFHRSWVRGLAYVARDFIYMSIVFALAYNFITPEYVPSLYARGALWALYTVVQGMVATGVWVLAHECGHQSFSESKVLNDTVGFVLHSLLLVPYFSWKISHGKHHKATGNLARDMVFVPQTREQYATKFGKLTHEIAELAEETPIYTALNMIGQQLAGWILYLFLNVTGHNNHEAQREGRGKGKKNGWFGGVNHFDPSSPLYEAKDGKLIFLSDLGLLAMGALLYTLGQKFGGYNMLVWYWIPYLWVNHWLVAITFLQHTDPSLPHYEPEAWNFARGAAATIDREFGFIGRHLMHGIVETHVLHHFISTIPFYNADEASEAIKPVMGQHYRSDVRGGSWGFLKSMWTSARMCNWVEPSEGTTGIESKVLFFRNKNGIGTKPVVLKASN